MCCVLNLFDVSCGAKLFVIRRLIHLLTELTHLQKTALQTGGEKVGASLGGAVEGADDEVHAAVLGHVTAPVTVGDHRSVADENVRRSEELTGGEAEVDELLVTLFAEECSHLASGALAQFAQCHEVIVWSVAGCGLCVCVCVGSERWN